MWPSGRGEHVAACPARRQETGGARSSSSGWAAAWFSPPVRKTPQAPLWRPASCSENQMPVILPLSSSSLAT